MRKNLFLLCVAVILATATVTSCSKGGNPNQPSPPGSGGGTGQTPPSPTVSMVELVFAPSSGETYSYGFNIPVTVRYEVAGGMVGDVIVAACVSIDGTPILESCKSQPVQTGSARLFIGIPSTYEGKIRETNWVVIRLVRGGFPTTGEVLAEKVEARHYRYE
ncbi:MAG: hypothetical protein A2735_03395 [Candidatus Yanofskybacteria bacterium RIFCSPHIGHO2_01_FULL_41_21]|uniref:Lipoprotein n=1 Tax=Candidatus Yanofskybacteria bacterium RIFCSPHIGHO2_01_FULL_41_21 TaxID=1802660 RepID=A0A1F8E9P9_9BACT|nr:MAG: hypothetical protein A2735_03395 [Candidatus Yanofskybacteria bacterium RIFCSPHIGHO2_01_FULL_41_21]